MLTIEHVTRKCNEYRSIQINTLYRLNMIHPKRIPLSSFPVFYDVVRTDDFSIGACPRLIFL